MTSSSLKTTFTRSQPTALKKYHKWHSKNATHTQYCHPSVQIRDLQHYHNTHADGYAAGANPPISI